MNDERTDVTTDECDTMARVRVRVSPTEVVEGRACWYPQMGGYVGRAVIVPGDGDSSCFAAYVWHNGEFPFTADSFGPDDTRWPAYIHHCDTGQFRRFADDVEAVFAAEDSGSPHPIRVPEIRPRFVMGSVDG